METQRVTWFPEGANACLLTAVQVKPGRITESDWLDALAGRVQAMVMTQENPQEAIAWAAHQLNQAGAIMLPSGPARAAGQILVRHNLDLVQEMRRLNPEFPQIAENNVSDTEMMDDLENWVELAEMALHP